MKTMERMTNPYFQDTEFASIMKAKHVIGGSDSDRDDINNLLNQSDPIQQHDPIESLLSEQQDLNFEVNQSDPIESLFSEGNQSDPIESLFSQPSLNLVAGQSNSDPIGSLLSQQSIDPIQETSPGVTSGSKGLIVANAKQTSRDRVKRVLYNIPLLQRKRKRKRKVMLLIISTLHQW